MLQGPLRPRSHPPLRGRDCPSALLQWPENPGIQPPALGPRPPWPGLRPSPQEAPLTPPPWALGGGGQGARRVSSCLDLCLQAPARGQGAAGVPWLPSHDPTLPAPRTLLSASKVFRRIMLPIPRELVPRATLSPPGDVPEACCPATACATRATAILISPKPPCSHCSAPLGPGGQDRAAGSRSSLPSHLWDPWFLPASQVKCRTGVHVAA